MAERKNLPALIALGLVLVVMAAVALDYWGYVIPATYTQVEVQIMGFIPADSPVRKVCLNPTPCGDISQ